MTWTITELAKGGNPRYVCHFLDILSDAERSHETSLGDRYTIALAKSRQLGGENFHNKQYGGGIALQSYNEGKLEKDILELAK